MEMKPMTDSMPYLLLYGFTFEERPYIHGYNDEASRDAAFESFMDTGRMEIYDAELDVVSEIKPTHVARLNFRDGCVNISNLNNV